MRPRTVYLEIRRWGIRWPARGNLSFFPGDKRALNLIVLMPVIKVVELVGDCSFLPLGRLPSPLPLPRGIINKILEKFLTVLFRNPVYGNGNPGEWINGEEERRERRRKKERERRRDAGVNCNCNERCSLSVLDCRFILRRVGKIVIANLYFPWT